MGAIIGTLVRFIGASAKGSRSISFFGQAIGTLVRTIRMLTGGIVGLVSTLAGVLISALGDVMDFFTQNIKKAIGFEISISGLLKQAEEARKYFSELRDELAFYSSSTGSTTNALNILTGAAANSMATLKSLQSAFSSMVDAGADSDKFIKDTLPILGEFELKTGLASNQFGLFSTKIQQALSNKKGITKDIINLQKSLIGTGLKSAQLEATLQGLGEAIEKLAFVTNGSSLNVKKLAEGYGKTVATFKAFGISAQTSTNFINNLLDPDSIEKNMLLMNKLGISYEDYNKMLNTGEGQDQFFDKILNNIGDVAQEANRIKDAGSRIKYLKDTLGLPPEIANKILKIAPQRIKAEMRRIKEEMDAAEKRDKWRKDLKAREEKYEEAMNFLRMEMVQPLVELMAQNRETTRKLGKAIKPIIQGLAGILADFMEPISKWFGGFIKDLNDFTNNYGKMDDLQKSKRLSEIMNNGFSGFFKAFKQSIENTLNNSTVQNVIIPLSKSIGEIIHTGIIYLYTVLAEEEENPDFTWEDAEILAKKRRAFNKAIKDGGMGFFKRGNVTIDKYGNIIESGINNFFSKGYSKKLRKAGILGQSNIYSISEEYVKIQTDKFTDIINSEMDLGAEIDNYNETYKKLSEAAQKADTESVIRLSKTFNRSANALMERAKILSEKEGVAEKGLDLYNDLNKNIAYYNEMIKPTLSTQTAEELRVNSFSPNENTKRLVEKILNTPSFMQIVSKRIGNVYFKDIDIIEKAIAKARLRLEDERKIFKFNEEKYNKIVSSKPEEILKKWYNKIFGDVDSFKFFLKSILEQTDVLHEHMNKTIKKTTVKGKPNANNNILYSPIGEFNLMSNAISNSSSVLSEASKINRGDLLGNIPSSNIRDIETKKALYLKSIANSTYDTAIILKYIANNLIFNVKGLAINDSATVTNAKMYNISDTESGQYATGLGVAKTGTGPGASSLTKPSM